jgi:hypothetical protein
MEQAQMIQQAQVVGTPGFQQAANTIRAAAPVVAQAVLEVNAALGNPTQRRTARERLAQARETDKAANRQPFEPIQTAEGELFVKRLTWPESYRAQLTASKGGNGVLDIRTGSNDLRALSIVALADCVYTAPDPDSKYFEGLEDAAAYVDSLDADIALLGRLLFDACLEYNPSLLPKGVAGLPVPEPVDPAALEAAEADLAELLQSVPSHPAEAAPPAEPQA